MKLFVVTLIHCASFTAGNVATVVDQAICSDVEAATLGIVDRYNAEHGVELDTTTICGDDVMAWDIKEYTHPATEFAKTIHYHLDQVRAMVDIMRVRIDRERRDYTATDRDRIKYIEQLLDKVLPAIEAVDN